MASPPEGGQRASGAWTDWLHVVVQVECRAAGRPSEKSRLGKLAN